MTALSDGWDGHGAPAPGEAAIHSARMVLGAVAKAPFSVRPSVEGGVAITYRAGGWEIFVESLNDGDAGYTTSEGGRRVESRDMTVAGLDPGAFLDKIRRLVETAATRRRGRSGD